MKSNKIIGLSVIALLALAPFSQAGKIGPTQDQAAPSEASGFAGWSLDNVTVKMTDTDYNPNGYAQSFDKADGSYPAMTVGDSFESDIHESLDDQGDVMVHLHGKDWPVGEPAGIKVINGQTYDKNISNSKPASCIMTTSYLEGAYLDATTPSETLCSSPFQSHKRFKLNLLPSMYIADGAYGKSVDLTFNVEADVNTWRYQVLQKINNYTDKRLDGFKVEVGFVVGTDGNFTTASANGADLRLSIGEGEDNGSDIWAPNELATFSHGLFGPADNHFDTDGFFDNIRAGYSVTLNHDDNDTITSGATLGSNYAALPVPEAPAGVTGQFGSWPPSIWAPKGIFWDDDNDPTTDAQLVAFWGDTGLGDYAWMKGDIDNFEEATPIEMSTWAKSPVHEIGIIEDVLNLGLNYIVEVGDVTTFPANTFTIRITPHFAATAEQVVPGYIGNVAPDLPSYALPEEDGGSSFAVNDKVSLLFTIFGFLVIGGLIARRKLA